MKLAESVTAASEIVTSMGRVKYLKPLYTALVNFGYKQKALDLYTLNENFYSAKAKNALKVILGKNDAITATTKS